MKKLHKSKDRMLFGVCSGISESTGIDVTILRLMMFFGAFFTGSILFWIYLLLAILLPTGE